MAVVVASRARKRLVPCEGFAEDLDVAIDGHFRLRITVSDG